MSNTNIVTNVVDSHLMARGIYPRVDCSICKKIIYERAWDETIVHQDTHLDVSIPTYVEKGDVFIGIGYNVCCQECAEKVKDLPRARARKGNTKGIPSENTVPIIYAVRQVGEYPDTTIHSGKWMIFPHTTNVNEAWQRVKQATESGMLGNYSKVTKSGKNNEHLICVYTYNHTDETDRKRIRQALSEIGFNQKLYYKADETTMQGLYSKQGQRTSTYSD